MHKAFHWLGSILVMHQKWILQRYWKTSLPFEVEPAAWFRKVGAPSLSWIQQPARKFSTTICETKIWRFLERSCASILKYTIGMGERLSIPDTPGLLSAEYARGVRLSTDTTPKLRELILLILFQCRLNKTKLWSFYFCSNLNSLATCIASLGISFILIYSYW